jgi:hypothetical protein
MAACLAAPVLAVLTGTGLAQTSTRTEWFRKAQWGVLMHYLGSTRLTPEEWNRRIDDFDVEGLARQLESAHARYFFITLGQNSGHFLSPNKTYDRITGNNPSKCSRRDLVADLYTALDKRGIKLLVYLPSGPPDEDKVAMEAFEWRKGPYRNAEFQRKWEQVIEEWSERWGSKVAGWWFDGCYWPNAMYRSAEAPNFASFAIAARKGNPNSIVAFNRGVVMPILSQTPEEDYTAGETENPSNIDVGEFWRDGAQTQMLSYLGRGWSSGAPRFTDDEAAALTKRLVDKGVVVTWDVPHDVNGLIGEAFVKQLGAIGQALGAR